VIPCRAAAFSSALPSSRFHRIPVPTNAYRAVFLSLRNAASISAHWGMAYDTRKTFRYRARSCRMRSVISAVAATGTRCGIPRGAAVSMTPMVSSER